MITKLSFKDLFDEILKNVYNIPISRFSGVIRNLIEAIFWIVNLTAPMTSWRVCKRFFLLYSWWYLSYPLELFSNRLVSLLAFTLISLENNCAKCSTQLFYFCLSQLLCHNNQFMSCWDVCRSVSRRTLLPNSLGISSGQQVVFERNKFKIFSPVHGCQQSFSRRATFHSICGLFAMNRRRKER